MREKKYFSTQIILMKKKHIAVVMGGYSNEYEISLGSGQTVCDNINTDKYYVYPIHILKEGWFYINTKNEKIVINKDRFSFEVNNQIICPDAVYNTIHGTPGENGMLQAYFDLLGIPHTSPDFYPAALSFNKRDCLTVLKKFGVTCATSYYLNKGETYKVDEIIARVGLPCFVKPNRAGSSFGVSKVKDLNELNDAIYTAFQEDDEVIIETAIDGIEVQVGVYNEGKKIIALPPTEIVSENEFFDYEAKYLGKSQEITPARISESETNLIQAEAKRIYTLLKMKGITRSDFILQNGIPYFIEINTNPGLSRESIIPKQVHESGMTLSHFFDILIQNVLP